MPNRRSVLGLMGSTALSALVLPGRVAAQGTAALVLVLDGLDPAMPVGHLGALFAPLVTSLIPTALILRPLSPGQRYPAALSRFLTRLARDYPDLVEPVPWLPGLSAESPYFQRRQASTACDRVRHATAPDHLPAPVSVATDAGAAQSFDALRAVGLRNVMVLPEDGGSGAESLTCDGRVACLAGAVRHSFAGGAGALPGLVDRALGSGSIAQVVLTLDGLAARSAEEVAAEAEALAAAIVAESRRVFVTLPREHLFWFAPPYGRRIAVVVPDAGDGAALRAVGALATAGIPASALGPGAEAGTDIALAPDASAALTRAGARGYIDDTPFATGGMDADGLFRFPVLRPGESGQDGVALAPPDGQATAAGLALQVAQLNDLAQRGAATLSSLSDFAAAVIAPDPVHELMRETRRDLALAAPAPQPNPAMERAALLADAARAWSYVAAQTDALTGLCPATVSFADERYFYNVMTMWDLGSLIGAVMAAHELRLIDNADFARRAGAILTALPRILIDGRPLPASEIATDRRATLTRDFNACDVGRLLSLLAELDRHPLTEGLAAKTVATWDLQGMMAEGRLLSVADGRRILTDPSHCDHYTARALRRWGIAAVSPYEVAKGTQTADDRMRILEAAARIGPLGSEPLLLEAVEMGLSPPAAWLADVLCTAEARAHAETGVFHAASETAIDRSPWFVYRGLRIADAETRFDVLTVQNQAFHRTPAFKAAHAVIDTKASYLLAAVRPGDYAKRLLDFMRARIGGVALGLSPGVYAATGRAMPAYSDINTNGIVLEAIACILRGHRPRHPAA